MNIIIKSHLNDHSEVLKQYIENDTTDKKLLAWLIKRLFLKLFKKEYMMYALQYINVTDLPEFHIKLSEKLGDELANDVMDAIKKHLAKKKK